MIMNGEYNRLLIELFLKVRMDPSGFEPEASRCFVFLLIKLFLKVCCKADALPG